MPVEAPLVATPQRWERPLNFPPGFWKRQLPTKYLEIASRGDIESLHQLLEQHPEFLNKRGAHNRTFLWEAARRGKLSAVRWLIEQGAELDATGCYNGETYVQVTPYCAAVYYQRADVAAYLRSQGTQLDIFRTAFVGDQSQVARELADHPAMLNAEDPHDSIYFTPLLAFPVAGGQASLLNDLLQRGADVAPYSAQLLSLAVRAGRMDLIDLLVRYGAQVQAVDPGIFVNTADLQIIRYLLAHGAPVTRLGKNGFPPLIYLARGDKGENPDRIQLLIEAGADVNAVGPKGRTALHYAAVAGYLRVISLLLDHGAAPGVKDDRGETPLSLARAAGKTNAAALLVQRGA